LRLRDFFYI